MTLTTVPWGVGGGAAHSADVARNLAYVATEGSSGVTRPNDMKVSALTTPAGFVRVGEGAAVIRGSYSNQKNQSYTSMNDGDVNVAIPSTSGTARADMLVLRIDDPQYGGSIPPNVASGPYAKYAVISNVGSTATDVPAGIGYPAIPLARINVPVNTSAITNAMITDLRKIANPATPTLTVINKRWGVDYNPVLHQQKTISWTTAPGTSSGGIAPLINDMTLFFVGVANVTITGSGVDSLRYAKGIITGNKLEAYCYGANNMGVVSEIVSLDVTVTGWVNS